MKKIYLLILMSLAMFSGNAFAGTDEDMTSEQVLDRLSENLYFYGGMQLDYHLVYDNSIEVEGSVVQKGRKAIYTTEGTKGWDDGTTRWFYTKATNTVVQSPTGKEPQNTGGDEGFGYLRVVEALTTNSEMSLKEKGDYYILTVKPTKVSPYQQITKADITINKSTFYPEQIDVKIKAFSIHYTIKNFQRGNFADAMFEFNPDECPGAVMQRRNK